MDVRVWYLAIAAITCTGTGLFVAPGPSTPHAVAAPRIRPDFNGDGKADLAVAGKDSVAVSFGGSTVSEVLRSPNGKDTEFGAALASGDFNGDGFDDLAVGSPWTSDGEAEHSGAVLVYPGSAQGLLDANGHATPTSLRQGSGGIPGNRERDDHFGYSLAAGPLSGSAADDLAVGAVGEALGKQTWAGAVVVLPGSTTGLETRKATVLSQASPGVPGTAERFDRFGSSLAIGDVTGDGDSDLVVGVSGENAVGMVHVFPGSDRGPQAVGSTGVSGTALGLQPSSLAELDPEDTGQGALFGWSLTLAEVTGDAVTDVVAGAPYAKVENVEACGAVAVLAGGPAGIAAGTARVITQMSPQVVGGCEKGDTWGWSIAVGDLTGDRHAEVVVGAHGESVGQVPGAGGFTVLRGGASGVSGVGSFGVSQNATNVAGTAEKGDGFAWTVQIRDMNHDGRQDILVGVPGEAAGTNPFGAVHVLLSTPTARPAKTSYHLSGRSFTDREGPVYWLGYAIGAVGGGPVATTGR
jgi:hypothetical protein